jgi:anti-anti-sigma factor
LNAPAEFRFVQVESSDNVCVVRLLAEVLNTSATIDQVSMELQQLAEPGAAQNMLLDFSSVSLVSSLMLGRLIRLKDKIAESGGQLVICCLQDRVYRVFAQTRLTKTFNIATDQTAGLAVFA